MKTIVILTYGGLISRVFSEDQDVEVITVDEHEPPDHNIELPPYRNY